MKISEARDFGTRECPSCACQVPANSNQCPICDYQFPQPTPLQKNARTWGAVLMLVLFVVLVLGLLRWLR